MKGNNNGGRVDDAYVSQDLPRMPEAISSCKKTEGVPLGSAENPKFLTVDF